MLILGNGFFKPTISALVGQLYVPGYKRIDTAYTIFYMGVNVGAFMAPIVCGYFGETGNPADFKWGFLIAAAVVMLTILIFQTQKNKYLVSPTGEQLGIIPDSKRFIREEVKKEKEQVTPAQKRKKWFIVSILSIAPAILFYRLFDGDLIGVGVFTACIIFPVLILLDTSLTRIERSRIYVIYIIAAFVIFFWSAFEQAGMSLTLFASEQTDRTIFGWEMPASWFQSFNPLFVVLLAFVMPMFWGFLNKHNAEPSSPVKQAIGLLLLSLGYLFICLGVKDVEPGMKINMLWLAGLYFIHTMGEMAVSPIGLSMVNRLSPIRFASLMMGIWYLSMAGANKLSGVLSSFYPGSEEIKTIFGFRIETMYDFFMIFVGLAGIASLILFLLSKKLQKMMHGVE